MEKGAGIPENAKLGERQGADGEASEPSMMKDADLSFDGSKESDGDEVFEEAVETATMACDSEKGVLTEGRFVEVTGTLEDNENSNLVNEFQKFDEVIGTPDAVKRSGDRGINAELLMSAIDMEKVVMDEKNGLMCDSNDDDVKGDSVETPASATPAGKAESPDDGYEVNAKLDKFPHNLDGVSSYNASLVETLTSEVPRTVDTDTIEEAKLEISEPSIFSESREVETTPGMPIVKCYVHETTEVQDSNEAKGGENGFMRPENGLCDHANLSETLYHQDPNIADIDALLEKTHEASSDIEYANEVKGSEVGPQPESESNGCVLHNDEQYVMEDVPAVIQGSRHHQDVSIKTSTNLHLGLEDDQFVEQEEMPFVSGMIIMDDENLEMKELNSDCLKTESQNAEKEENKGIAAADTSVMHHVKESSKLEVGSLPKLEDSTANLEIAKVDKSHRPFESSSNTEHAARAQEPVSHNTSVNRKEVKLAVNISSSANSVTPHPAGLGHAAPLLGPTPQNVSENKERGSRPAVDISSENGNLATPARPAGLGRSASPLEVTSRAVQQPRVNGAIPPTQNPLTEDPTNGEAEEYDETREKLQMIRVKFLRLAHRLGQTPHNVVVAQVLYRLGLAEQLQGRSGGRVAAFSFDRASAVAEQLEASGQEPLDFTCTIMVLGKSGVGKSATINSIFDEVKFGTDAFQSGTKMVQDIVGTVQGIRVRVIDTPGLLPSWSDQRQNEKILCSVKRFIKKTPPDIVLYLDRLDMQSRDFSDMPLLRTITEIFGQSIWFNAIVVLTHAASAPPEGPNGTTTSYDMFVTQRSHIVQQAIRQAAGDMRLMNPVSLVENHSACRTNRAGQRVLPNGQVWKPHLLLLSFASKILAEANTLLKLQDNPPGKNYAARARSPPLPFLLSSLLQSRPEVKLPSEQFGDDDDDVDDDLSECSDSEDESEYDALPPFNPLTKAQLEKLTKVQRKAYFDELEYREKLFIKKQLKEEKRRRKMMKKMQEAAKDLSAEYGENAEEGTSAEASVPVPMPDLALPATFDSDNPTHRYRSLDSSNPWLVRAVLDPNGWDHDIGYDGLNIERLFVIKEKVPISFSGHISKDKKDANLQMEIASSVRHGKGKATSLGFDMQSIGKDIAYTLRSETRFCNHRVNKAAAGLSATVLGDVLTGGIKLEDKLIVGKRGQLVVSGGAIYGRGDIAYGGSLEATLKDKDHPVGRFLSTLGLSVMDWHGDLAIGCNSQTQIPLGRHTNLIGRFNINNRGSGQVSVRINSSEQLQIVLIGIIPLVKKILGYSEQVQYG